MTQSIRNNFQSHPFHLVSPSPWPLNTSISLLILTCTASLSMHNYVSAYIYLYLSLIILASSMAFWFRDVISESSKKNKILNSSTSGTLCIAVLLEPSSTPNCYHIENTDHIENSGALCKPVIETITNFGELSLGQNWKIKFLVLGLIVGLVLILALILHMRPHSFNRSGPLPNAEKLKDSDEANQNNLLYKLVVMGVLGTRKSVYSRRWSPDIVLNAEERIRLGNAGINAEAAGILSEYNLKMSHNIITYEVSGFPARSSVALICIVYAYSPR